VTSSGFLSVVWRVLTVSGALLPAGFFLGSIVNLGGDPGLPELLVPVGAVNRQAQRRNESQNRASQRVHLQGDPNRPALLIRGGELDDAAILSLKALRDDTPVDVAE